jgi:hypothetical protein
MASPSVPLDFIIEKQGCVEEQYLWNYSLTDNL